MSQEQLKKKQETSAIVEKKQAGALSVSFLENAPHAITALSNTKRCASDIKVGLSPSNSISLIFNLLNFPPFFIKRSKNFNKIFFGFLACLA